MELRPFDHIALCVQVGPSDCLLKTLCLHDATGPQVWRKFENLGCGLVPRSRGVIRLEFGFRLWVIKLDGVEHEIGWDNHFPGLSTARRG